MTHAQKERIASMRADGESYANIAAALGLSENTVKSYGRRNKLGDAAVQRDGFGDTKPACANCGRPMVVSGQKTKRFCSEGCRMAWWRAHPERMNRKSMRRFTCSFCGVAFDSYGNGHRKYCSHACYARAKVIVNQPVEVSA